MRSGSAKQLVPYVLLSLCMAAPEAWAYLDPSTGSLILSSIVGMFAAAGLALKTYWYKLKRFFQRRDGSAGRDEGGAAGSAAKPGPESGPG